ncbi:MAG: hypothetical protein KIS75_01020 [Chromatiales bacterium]|nr:hypothetical protein [Chromatiales bacterium]
MGWFFALLKPYPHAKTFAFDRQRLFVGSLNLDPRSAVLNTEMGIVFDNAQLAGNVGDWFDARLRDVAYELKLDDQDNIEWVEHRADDRIYQAEPNTGFSNACRSGSRGCYRSKDSSDATGCRAAKRPATGIAILSHHARAIRMRAFGRHKTLICKRKAWFPVLGPFSGA